MSRRLNRLWLLPALLLASQSWALGLGDIRLNSALNEPLRAEIELLAATPEELNNLTIQLASQETFERYDLDRPLFLSRMQFRLIKSGSADGYIVRVTSQEPITEPFVTFLVEAVWSRGRLLREYTVLLDPPTFAPPPVRQQTQPVQAPTRAPQADSGQIQRPAPQQAAPAPAPAPQPTVQVPTQTAPPSEPAPFDPVDEEPPPTLGQPTFDTSAGGDVVVQRGETLWSITSRVRPDSRLTMNQTMLAIYEANPQAFAGNINVMSAGATLRIPSADEVFRITRGDALAEVQRQNAAWGGIPEDTGTQTRPELTLVPPDDDIDLFDDAGDTGDPGVVDPVDDLIAADDARIAEIEDLLIQHQDSLIEITDNELAALRSELAELRGEEPPEPLPVDAVADDPTLDDTLIDEDLLDDDTDPTAIDDDLLVDDTVEDTTPVVEDTAPPAPTVAARPREDSLLDTIKGYVLSIWGIIGGALIVAVALLVWFARRSGRGDDEDSTGMWESLDQDEIDGESLASTERLRALAREDDTAIVVVEQESTPEEPGPEEGSLLDTMEAPVVEADATTVPADDDHIETTALAEPDADTDVNKSLEDTFSSETAINLDQSDPVAEADFHMAYGLYDQAADLINGALDVEPEREDLLSKLCEIYFVWGNRDAFIDAAGRMRATVSDDANPEWDKIVIMGQQIASDHEMFSGVSAGAATKAVDLSFEAGMDDVAELDIDFEADGHDGAVSEVIDLGAESGQVPVPDVSSASAIDFDMGEGEEEVDLDVSVTREMPQTAVDTATVETSQPSEDTADLPAADSPEETVETPTIEQQFAVLESTGALPAMPEFGDNEATELASLDDLDERDETPPTDATAEIDLDDLGLDLEGLDDDDSASLPDLEYLSESQTLKVDESLVATGTHEAADDDPDATGRNLAVDISDDTDATGIQEALDEATGIQEALDATGEMPGIDDPTGKNLELPDDDSEDTDVGIDTRLLDATGQTQILSEDMAVETASDVGASLSDEEKTMLANPLGDDDDLSADLGDDAATMLAPLDEDEESTVLDDDSDFDFAKTEALPKDVFTGNMAIDETGEIPSLAGSTDMDLDLDDLTAALKISEVGDTVNQMRDDATVEQPRVTPGDVDLDVGDTDADGDDGETQALAPEDLSGDLHDARTMTEVGTKLDLARAYVDMGDPGGARSILEEVLDEGDEGQRQQAQQLLESLPT